MKSPCIQVCVLKEDICTGCGRTKQEITAWSRMTDGEREEIILRLSVDSKTKEGYTYSNGKAGPTMSR